jgi:hypothetical protein
MCPTYVGTYDPIAGEWDLRYRLSPGSTPTSWIFDPFPIRNDFVIQELDEKFYAIGGRNRENPSPELDVYDARSGVWLAGAPMPTARDLPSTGSIGGQIFVAGGANGDRQGLRTLEEYDPKIDLWIPGPDMPTPRLNAASGVIDGKLYVVGGMDHLPEYDHLSALSIVEVYDPLSRPRERRVCLCHDLPGDQEPPTKLCVSASAAQAHLRLHGDTLGGCGLRFENGFSRRRENPS